jgi:hypothetical protein
MAQSLQDRNQWILIDAGMTSRALMAPEKGFEEA